MYRDNNKRADALSNMAFENIDTNSLTEDLGIQELHEDWSEEIVIPVKIATNKNLKQTSITDFILKGSLFPDI